MTTIILCLYNSKYISWFGHKTIGVNGKWLLCAQPAEDQWNIWSCFWNAGLNTPHMTTWHVFIGWYCLHPQYWQSHLQHNGLVWWRQKPLIIIIIIIVEPFQTRFLSCCRLSVDAVMSARCSIIIREFSILASQIRSERVPAREQLQGTTQPALTDRSKCWSAAWVCAVGDGGRLYLHAQ